MNSSDQNPPLRIFWFEIPVTDMARARTFYESILQIKLSPLQLGNGLDMALFPAAEGEPGGALACHPKAYFPGTQGPLIYLDANPDLAQVLARVEAAGGKVLVPKTQISAERGYMALLEDPEGNRIGLMSKA
jgi:predicted enzyme related to lactoylglutathione lyase